jgi:hypothetical protein
MSPEELDSRWRKNCTCDHNMKAGEPGLCKICKESKPYMVFLLCPELIFSLRGDASGGKVCKGEDCCGWFWGPGSEGKCGQRASWTIKKEKVRYTSESVKVSLAAKEDAYFAKLAIGQPPTWKCDQRTKDIFCLYQWLIDELTAVKCTDEDRRHMQWYFNRKSRAEDDLFSLAAKVMNDTLDGKIDQYKGK